MPPGLRVVYDVAGGEAMFGDARVAGHALVWELSANDREPDGAKLSAPVDLDRSTEWVVRCDCVEFPPGGVAFRHVHPGPGIRCLLRGALTVETGGRRDEHGPFDAWFESGREPVYAAASSEDETAFVRVLLLPRAWAGRRTIRYVDPADEEKPKTQRATILLEQPIELP